MEPPRIKDPKLNKAIREARIDFKGPELMNVTERGAALEKANEWYWEQGRKLESYHRKAKDETTGHRIGVLLEEQYRSIKSVIDHRFQK